MAPRQNAVPLVTTARDWHARRLTPGRIRDRPTGSRNAEYKQRKVALVPQRLGIGPPPCLVRLG